MKRIALCVAAALLLMQPAYASQADKAGAYISDLGNKAIAVMSNKALDKAAKQSSLEVLFADNIDFAWVGRFVMGRSWNQATPEQKASYLEAYKNFLTKHYTARFSDYTSGSFKVLSAKQTDSDEFLVSMEIKSDEANAAPVAIDYKIRTAAKGFKVYDIIVEGVSMITTQRSEFGSVLNQSGIDGLISRLQSKTQTASGK